MGQLSIDASGRSRFFGPAAAAHVLPAQGLDDARVPFASPDAQSRGQSLSVSHTIGVSAGLPQRSSGVTFPFGTGHSGYAQDGSPLLLHGLPVWREWQRMEEVYWRASTWRFVPMTKHHLSRILSSIYGVDSMATTLLPPVVSSETPLAELSVLYMVLAIACLFDPSLPNHDSRAEQYSELGLECLGSARFLSNISVDSL